ncbi:MAG: DUF2127 domain-containing protein [Armatimonadota bacterium]
MDNTKRPLWVSVAGWYVTIFGLFGFIVPLMIPFSSVFRLTIQTSGGSVVFVFAYSLIYAILRTIAGIGILNGCNWSRFLYPTVVLGGIIVSFFLYDVPNNSARQSGIYFRRIADVAAFALLVRSDASRFFAKDKMSPDTTKVES